MRRDSNAVVADEATSAEVRRGGPWGRPTTRRRVYSTGAYQGVQGVPSVRWSTLPNAPPAGCAQQWIRRCIRTLAANGSRGGGCVVGRVPWPRSRGHAGWNGQGNIRYTCPCERGAWHPSLGGAMGLLVAEQSTTKRPHGFGRHKHQIRHQHQKAECGESRRQSKHQPNACRSK